MNNGKPTYITGSHYMYLQWSKIDVGAPDFREANRLFLYFGKPVRQTKDLTVCVILKIDVVDFLLCQVQKQLI